MIAQRAARTVLFGLLILVVGACFCSSISDQELQGAFKQFFAASDQMAKEEALRAAEETTLGVCMGSLCETRADLSERNRKMLHLLKALRYEISWGLTDDKLEGLAKKGVFGGDSKIETQIDGLFDSDLITRDLEVLGELSSSDALTFVTVMCEARVIKSDPLPEGANSTTWAAEDLAPVVHDLKLSRLAARSELVKLFIEKGDLELPKETCARFRWSGAEPICIKLPPIVKKRP
jgi:hypothetical protein